MQGTGEERFDLSAAKATALGAAREWGLALEQPFAFSCVSYVAPAGEAVVKVAWEGDDESLHEGDALELWNGDGAVRLLSRSGRALLEERAVPGDDLAAVSEDEATAIAVDVAGRLWRPAGSPFRPVAPEVSRWLDRAEREESELVPLARELLAELDPAPAWLVHGDFHHHNLLRNGERFVAIDPKPYLADREYDLPSFLWNPHDFRLRDLSPPGFTEVEDGAAALSGLRELLDMFDTVRLVDSDVYDIGNVTYLRARLHFVHPEAGERMLEQHHLLTIADDRIEAIDELCTGFFAP